MRLIVAGILLMLFGLAALFAIAVHALPAWLALSVGAFGVSFAGMVLALHGLGRHLRVR